MNKEVEKLGQRKKAKYEKEEILRFRAGEESLPPPKIARNWSDEERLFFFMPNNCYSCKNFYDISD